MTVQGIDVSMFQGAFDWAAWRGKIGFGLCKAGEGHSGTDPQFAHNWGGMWAMNCEHTFPRFAYLFFHARQDPVAQAAHLVSVVRGHGLLPGDNFVLDVEATATGANDGLTPAQCAPRAVRCMQEINRLAPGHRVLPYMNPSWARAGGSTGMEAWHPWIADYGVPQPDVPPPWDVRVWAFWQRSDQPLDLDVFNGSERDLAEFCRMPERR